MTNFQLKDISLFKDLSEEEHKNILSYAKRKTFEVNSFLFEEGQEAFGMYVLLKGSVKLTRITADGKEIVLFLVRAGHCVGEGAVFQKSSYPASAMSIKKVECLFISSKNCFFLIEKFPILSKRLLKIFAMRQRMLIHKLTAQSERNALMRVAGYILHRISLENKNDLLYLDISRNDLANLLGLARETLSRQLSILAECGAINLQGNTIHILDRKKLKR